MALQEVQEPLGPPWSQPLAGAFDQLRVSSELLAGNPLGDPATRPLYVYRSPGVTRGDTQGVPVIYLLQGYSGQLDTWLSRKAFEPTAIERFDAMFSAGECPDAVLVFLDAWTSLGGSQFLNSTAVGPYTDYICDEVVPFIDGRYPTIAGSAGRAVAGHSSGGYGAMALAMLRPDTFGAFGSQAGDALFECSYLPEFPRIARTLRDHFDGSVEVMLKRFASAPTFDYARFGPALSAYAMAAAYSPDPERPRQPLLPFEIATGRLIPAVWERWLEHDPVRMAPRHAEALLGMCRIYLEAGRSDEYYLDLGAQAFAAELERIGVTYTLELFDGGHGGTAHRDPRMVRELVVALTG